MSINPSHVGEEVPQLFIGLGGGGSNMVMRIHRRLHNNRNWMKYRRATTSFVLLDTNYKDLQRHAGRDGVKTIMISDPSLDALNLIIHRGDRFLKSWRGDAPVRASAVGAGQIRIEARTKLYAVEEKVRKVLNEALDDTLREGNQFLKLSTKLYDVLFFGTLGGGTCSGSFLPMAYMVREEIRRRQWSPQLTGHFVYGVGVAGRVGELSDFVMANSHAAIMELEHLQRSAVEGIPVPFAYRQPRGDDEPRIQVAEPPFDWLFMADKPDFDLDSGEAIDSALADSAFINLSTPARTWFDGAADNYTRFRVKTQKKLAPDNAGGQFYEGVRYSTYWATQGGSALSFPALDFAEYCKEMTVARILREQFRSGADRASDLPADVLSPDEIRLVRARQWVKAFDQRAETELKKQREAKKRLQEALGDGVIDPKSTKAAGLPGIVQRVTGQLPGVEAIKKEEPVKSDDDFADEEAEDASAATKAEHTDLPLIARVVELIGQRIEQMHRKMSVSVMGSEEVLSSGMQLFDKAVRDAETLARQTAESAESLKAYFSKGDWLEALSVGAHDPIDATTLRYLVALLRLDAPGTPVDAEIAGTSTWRGIDSALALAKKAVEQASAGFCDVGEDRKGLEKSFGDASRMHAESMDDSWLAEMRRRLPGGDDGGEAGRITKANELKSIFSARAQSTDDKHRALLLVAALEGLRAFLEGRLENYVKIGEEAERRAAQLEGVAHGRMTGKGRVEEQYSVGFEVLQMMGQRPSQRLWRHFYEDRFLDGIAADVDGATVGSIVDENIREQEQEKAFLPHKVVDQVIRQLKELMDPSLDRMLWGHDGQASNACTLADALEYEAYCSLISEPDTLASSGREAKTELSEFERALEARRKPKSRPSVMDEMRMIFEDHTHPRHDAVRGHICSYVQKKLESCVQRATPLATVSEGDQGSPSHQARIAIVDSAIEQKLKHLLPADGGWAAMKVTAHDGEGLQAWDDHHNIFVFAGHGSLPIWRFRYLDASYQAYQRIATGSHWAKPHPLHIDINWEPPENKEVGPLMQVATRFHEERYLASLRAEALDVFGEAVVRGLVHREPEGGSLEPGWHVRLGDETRHLGDRASYLPSRFVDLLVQFPSFAKAILSDVKPPSAGTGKSQDTRAAAEFVLAQVRTALHVASAAPDRMPRGLEEAVKLLEQRLATSV